MGTEIINQQTMQVAEEFQNDCMNVVSKILDETKVGYEDVVNVWMLTKLAEFELRLRYLEDDK